MIHTAATLPYTLLAIGSLRLWTPAPYRLVVLDNDGQHQRELLKSSIDAYLVPPAGPAPFAANANQLLAQAQEDLVLLNNDILFTPGWLEPLLREQAELPGLVSPASNWSIQGSVDGFQLKPTMCLQDIIGYEHAVLAFARHVAENFRGQRRAMHCARTFACYVPAAIGRRLPFDERFVNGGEDDDLSIRAHLDRIPIYEAMDSFLLHFGGKSLWDGPETPAATAARNRVLEERLIEKWSADLAALMLGAGEDQRGLEVLEAYSLGERWRAGRYSECIRVLARASQI